MSNGKLVFYESFVDTNDFPNWTFSRDTPPRHNTTLLIDGDPELGSLEYGNAGVTFAEAWRDIPIEPGKQYRLKLAYQKGLPNLHNREIRVRNAGGSTLWSDTIQVGEAQSPLDLLIPEDGVVPEAAATLRIFFNIRGSLSDGSWIAVGHIELWDLTETEPDEITGDLDAVEPAPDTATVRGSVAVTGEIVARERGGDGAQVRGSPIVAASMSATEAGQDSAAITGSAVIAASLDAREAGSDAANAAVTVAITGALDATEPASDTAEIIEGESGEITGTLDAREPGSDSSTITGSVAITGAMLAREPGGDGASIRASAGVTGAVAAAEAGADAAEVVGAPIAAGVLGALEHGPDSAEIAGTAAITGDLDATEPAGDTALFLEVVIDTPTPGERTFHIEPEDRSWCIAPDDRTFIVEAA